MSEVTFKKIRFKNFMCFGNMWTEVDLTHVGTSLIVGENLDNGGSSGAGKSTLISAISYVLFDKIPTKVKKDKLLNGTNDKKNTTMEVCLEFTKGADEYVIRRFRGAVTGIQLLMNGDDLTPAALSRGEDSFNAKIIEIIGFSWRLFSTIVLFRGNNTMFLDCSVGEQRALIEELFKITTLTRKANALKKIRDDTDREIALVKQLIAQQKAQNSAYLKRVSDAETRVTTWESKHDAELLQAQRDIDRISSIDFESEGEIHKSIEALQAEVVTADAEVRQLTTERSSKAREKSPLVTEHALLGAKIRTNDAKQKQLHKEHTHLSEAKCPYCLQQFEADKSKITEIWQGYLDLSVSLTDDEARVAEHAAAIAEFDAKLKLDLEQLDVQIREKTVARDELQAQVTELKSVLTYKTYKEHVNASGLINTLQDRLQKLAAEMNPHLDALAVLVNEGAAPVDEQRLNDLLKLHEHQQFLFKLLTDKNSFIRKNIISKTMPFLNKRIGYYNEQLLLPHIVLFQADMSCEISQYGRELDHGNLSNGEQKKLNLSLCLAFRDVMTFLHSKVNVLFTDEIDGGSISGPDVDALISTCKHKAWDDEISIFIISHRPEFEGRCDRNLLVRKEGGFSTLIDQPEE